jgi:hypothetical protein
MRTRRNAKSAKTTALACLTCCALSSSGCVMQSTYDAVLQDGMATKAELDRARDEHNQLARLVSEFERLNDEMLREAETTVAAVQQAKDDAERERLANDRYHTKLKQRIAQAAKQHNALRYEITVAQENTAALQELVDGYQQKIRDDSSTRPLPPAAEPAVHKPFDPSTIPPPQDLPTAPAVESRKLPTASTTPPAPSPATRPQEGDSDWLTSVTNWLVSLWQSVFP